ncbi:hypothetical protein J7438_06465 [Thalassotalea sp. G20_0]|uniref:hypothetical protein n=1 Tax=Thalassotalea sp. G20_0 TaxID=2821093 RepID=UPI001ADB7AD7|nr:hypothetical protein [Thalassotalea sp. G20_0]MBO9493728.1 hypothetical protein [Thalassotalea sp. G20_0]
MDTSNQLNASRKATSLNPESTGTDQQSTDLIKRWSTAGRPVAIVRPQVSVKADTPVHAMTGPTTAQDVTHIINPDLPYFPQGATIDPEMAYRFLLAIDNESSAPSASGGEPLISNPASTNDTERSDLLITSMTDLPPRCNIL